MRAYATGIEAIERAIGLLGEPEHSDRAGCLARSLAEANYTRLLLGARRGGEARARARLAKKFAERSASTKAQIEAAGVEGLCEIVDGSKDVGREIVLKALETARAIPTSYRDALLTSVQACEAAGDPGAALAYHREFALAVKRALRQSIVEQQRLRLAAGDEASAQLAQLMDDQDGRYRQDLSALVGSSGNDGRLLSLALSAEAVLDPEGLHPQRVGRLAALLARRLGQSADFCRDIELAARLHDIGMIGVPKSVQAKPGPLTADEQRIVRQHPLDGAELVTHSGVAYAQLAEDVIRAHHERWDGLGYPDSIRGNGIPLAGRITALADAFDTMTHDRPYGAARSAEAALREIEASLGRQFDPVIGAAFIEMVRDLGGTLDRELAEACADSPLSRARALLPKAADASQARG
jgi:HD-GYP domain-containing protein (c-di-GMP phosphodiesterase class II)